MALLAGDENAFEMFFRTNYQSLCRYAYTFLNDTDEAEEIVQNSFLSVWEKRSGLQVNTSGKSYMFAMVRNACLNVIKHRKIQTRHANEHMAITRAGEETVSEAVQGAELEREIGKALQTLPEQCRLVFTMSRFEELKYQEIANQLQISVKTVENHMGKALKLMREQLKDYLVTVLIAMMMLLK